MSNRGGRVIEHSFWVLTVVALLAAALVGCAKTTTVDGVVLEGTTWQAISVAGVDPVVGREPTIHFAAPGVSGSAGCNGYGSTHTEIDGNAITITNLGMQAAFCEPHASQLMKVEQRFYVALAAATEIHVVDGRLELSTPMGAVTFALISGPAETVR